MKCAECKQNPRNRCDKVGYDCTGGKLQITDYQEEVNKEPHRISANLQREHGNNLTRLEELMLYCKQMNYKKIGLPFCVGLNDEAQVVAKILSQEFQVLSVCCKICGLDKKEHEIPYVDSDKDFECVCNPIGQAKIMNRAQVELNIQLGLCVGHDILFTKYAEAPVTVLAVKDRLLANNPLGVVYSGYWRKKFKVKE